MPMSPNSAKSENRSGMVPASRAHDDTDTRQRLTEAAVSVFGQQGFEGASTRQIAAAAGTNISSIAYHFGNKEKLYLAAADHIAQKIGRMVDAIEAQLADKRQAIENGSLPPEEAVALIQNLWGEWLHELFAGKKHEHEWTWFIIREQANPTEAFDRIYDSGVGRLLEILAGLIGCAEQRPAQSLQVRLHAFTLFGQMIAFKCERATVARYLGWKTPLEAEALNAIKALVSEDIARLLRHP